MLDIVDRPDSHKTRLGQSVSAETMQAMQKDFVRLSNIRVLPKPIPQQHLH
jgi:hypothetical protein